MIGQEVRVVFKGWSSAGKTFPGRIVKITPTEMIDVEFVDRELTRIVRFRKIGGRGHKEIYRSWYVYAN